MIEVCQGKCSGFTILDLTVAEAHLTREAVWGEECEAGTTSQGCQNDFCFGEPKGAVQVQENGHAHTANLSARVEFVQVAG